MLRRIQCSLIVAVLLPLWGWQDAAAAAVGYPIYDWNFTPTHVKVKGPESIHVFATVTNLPHSPVNLLGSQWYGLDMYPGEAARLGGPYRVTQLSSLGFSSMNLAPGESATFRVVTFVPQSPRPVGYSDLLLAGGYMRLLGPNGEFLDVGGLDRQVRVTVVPEPISAALWTMPTMALLVRRKYRRSA